MDELIRFYIWINKVLDATDDEPWGPHGTAMAEIAQATKKLYVLATLLAFEILSC